MGRRDPRNVVRYWQAPDLAGLSLLHADFTRHDYAPHMHEGFVVAVTEIGGSAFTSRGRTGAAHAQVLLAFNPAEVHSGRMGHSARWRYRSFYLEEAGARTVLGLLGLDRQRFFAENVFADAALVARFLDLHRALEGPDDGLRREELLVCSFGALFARHGQAEQRVPQGPTERPALAPVLRMLRARYAEPLSLEEMARAAGLTPFQLIALFNRAVGLTPHAYLTQLRLRAAIARLRRGVAVAEVAADAGFYDQSALNNHFKRAFGMTPLQFARAERGRITFNFGQ